MRCNTERHVTWLHREQRASPSRNTNRKLEALRLVQRDVRKMKLSHPGMLKTRPPKRWKRCSLDLKTEILLRRAPPIGGALENSNPASRLGPRRSDSESD
mmetsp:Transcript_11138/g.19482  ORF Transcript_11138/g.19482 Transcript_11138/m.19482 type:complete len:100 (-) Transcript_11138:111-410(-)|eukprot:CAMPEP_0196663018 /NCGR_PEP_ID=MMETSP1086-20130531/51194_1 /TAXON_ID=77921 /ORGANISM="Cyanoptyche  gloeocystis , Strain SAG4.97" /LENGTH=99 /DNA_ID=CAMNT_0041998671 /DNA_START=369 /DNA_END=668 /DNA_ORIENTATION=+